MMKIHQIALTIKRATTGTMTQCECGATATLNLQVYGFFPELCFLKSINANTSILYSTGLKSV